MSSIEIFAILLFVYYAVVEFGELCLVPTVGCTYKVSCDALQLVKVLATALGALLKVLCGVLVPAVEATVAVVVNRAVSDIVLVHHVHYAHDCLGVVCGVTVNLNVEDVSTACKVMIRCFNLGLVACAALVVYWHVVTIGVVVAVGDTWDYALTLAVATCETA